MTELQLVDWIRKQGTGIGDDCAILPFGKVELLVTTDMFLEDIHFQASEDAVSLGHRALARGLSDIAAMSGKPRWYFVSLALAEWSKPAWVKRFYQGMRRLGDKHGAELAGGDLSHTGKVAADIMVIGEAPRSKALRRSTARVGDGIWVSGVLGGQQAKPEPRVELGLALRGKATACMDLSDGLSIDLHRLCKESAVAAVIDRPLPVAPGATLDEALNRGEDYELLFTSAARREFRPFRGLPLTRIGTIVEGRAGAMTLFGTALKPGGYDHFAR
ncbi:MAG: thiamine-monophosphate kinase [Bryobacterales bacterium]|nr:thiamine-monophosphate kinase [Bryobacterales bacterium]